MMKFTNNRLFQNKINNPRLKVFLEITNLQKMHTSLKWNINGYKAGKTMLKRKEKMKKLLK